ncbi:Ubiquinone biosynthesis O-methyltransferase, mitochondrial [Neolewinella maritima]|uniref:Ubiquinone biosynthesis O-methyltransferase, mitochondrial n=1 Tax=Neolewinella maritima TaxID=1383882 RepID=A0ABM9AWF9_9BACT|nr:class I SAM-dependent methyltransferase [Neolewinella maritima]CAH0998770.1 Ubiquinone biosynthesis O-methyltransferase, mitochondrial [Neolewinella maritima]
MFDITKVLRPAPDARPAPGEVINLLADGGENYVAHYQRDAVEFDYFAAPADPATLHENERLHQEILRHVPSSTRVVLDVGCGSAWVARELLPTKEAVISFDIALRNTTEALRRYPAPNHYAVTGDAFDLPFQDGSIDAVISSEVMEHVPDVSAYLRSLVRVVKPGGTIVISTPYNETIQYSLCIHCNQPTPLHAHLHSFNEALMEELLAPLPVRYTLHTLSNKALLYLRTHRLLRHLPFGAWRAVDGLANRVVRKPARLVVVIKVET